MKIVNIAIVITGTLPYIILIVGVLKNKIKQSFATWLLWFILDSIIVIGAIAQDGNYLLYSVFGTGTILTAISLLYKKQFSWGKVDTFIAFLVVLCILVLLFGGAYVSIIATTVALNIAGIPQLIATNKDPKSTSTKAYSLFAVSSLISVISAEAWTVEDRLPATSSFVFCLVVVLLSLRKI